MESQKRILVGKSRSVPMMIHPMIFTRPRCMYACLVAGYRVAVVTARKRMPAVVTPTASH
eukprot:COSAG01_NODE_9032_length_2576_cov_6.898668_2_plen_60_part_00